MCESVQFSMHLSDLRMNPPVVKGYVVALIAVPVFVLVIHAFLWPLFEPHSPLPLLTLAVMLTAWYGGWGPGLLATFLSMVFSAFFFLEPIGSFQITHLQDAIELQFFALSGIGITFFAQRLRDAAKRKTEILDSIQDGFLAMDREFRITYTNPAAETLLGKSRSDFIGRNLLDVCPPESGPTVVAECSRALQRADACTL